MYRVIGFGNPSGLAIDEHSILCVTGEFTRIGDVEARNVASWDGAAWHSAGEGIQYPQEVIEDGDSAVYVRGANSDSLHIWNREPDVWTAVPLPRAGFGGCNLTVSAVLRRADGLYVGAKEACVVTGKATFEHELLIFGGAEKSGRFRAAELKAAE